MKHTTVRTIRHDQCPFKMFSCCYEYIHVQVQPSFFNARFIHKRSHNVILTLKFHKKDVFKHQWAMQTIVYNTLIYLNMI